MIDSSGLIDIGGAEVAESGRSNVYHRMPSCDGIIRYRDGGERSGYVSHTWA